MIDETNANMEQNHQPDEFENHPAFEGEGEVTGLEELLEGDDSEPEAEVNLDENTELFLQDQLGQIEAVLRESELRTALNKSKSEGLPMPEDQAFLEYASQYGPIAVTNLFMQTGVMLPLSLEEALLDMLYDRSFTDVNTLVNVFYRWRGNLSPAELVGDYLAYVKGMLETYQDDDVEGKEAAENIVFNLVLPNMFAHLDIKQETLFDLELNPLEWDPRLAVIMLSNARRENDLSIHSPGIEEHVLKADFFSLLTMAVARSWQVTPAIRDVLSTQVPVDHPEWPGYIAQMAMSTFDIPDRAAWVKDVTGYHPAVMEAYHAQMEAYKQSLSNNGVDADFLANMLAKSVNEETAEAEVKTDA